MARRWRAAWRQGDFQKCLFPTGKVAGGQLRRELGGGWAGKAEAEGEGGASTAEQLLLLLDDDADEGRCVRCSACAPADAAADAETACACACAEACCERRRFGVERALLALSCAG